MRLYKPNSNQNKYKTNRESEVAHNRPASRTTSWLEVKSLFKLILFA